MVGVQKGQGLTVGELVNRVGEVIRELVPDSEARIFLSEAVEQGDKYVFYYGVMVDAKRRRE